MMGPLSSRAGPRSLRRARGSGNEPAPQSATASQTSRARLGAREDGPTATTTTPLRLDEASRVRLAVEPQDERLGRRLAHRVRIHHDDAVDARRVDDAREEVDDEDARLGTSVRERA